MGGKGGHLADLGPALDRSGHLVDGTPQGAHALLDAALERHRVGACGDVLEALVDDGLRENRRGRRAVAGHVVGLARRLLEKLGAHVLERVLQLDLLGDGHAVAAYLRRTELLVEHYVPAARAKRYAHGVGHLVDAALHGRAGLLAESQLLWHCSPVAPYSFALRRHRRNSNAERPAAPTTVRRYFLKRMSSSLSTRYSTSPSRYSVPAYLE